MEVLYWIFEYIKVFLAYGFILFIWPLLVFRKYLKGKSVTFRFSFCVTTQVIIINTVVLCLGLVHLLNKWTMCIIFYGILLWSFKDELKLTEKKKKTFKYLITGTMGWKHFAMSNLHTLKKISVSYLKQFGKFYKKHFWEYTLLIITLIYGMVYFSYGAFQDYSYGFGDMYVHHSWIYGLVEGQIFYEGIYPEAMHCVVYALHVLVGVDVYSCMLFLAGIHIAVILLAAYCLMKEIFHWRFSSVFVLILFLIVDVVCIDEVFSMSRLQWTLPQEYGFHTIYICALYLILYLKKPKEFEADTRFKIFKDENLFLFLMALAASIAIHFYVTIMAFFVCFSFAVFKLGKIFKKKVFMSLVVSVMCGLLIAVAPMIGGFASGIPFQGSLNWALAVIEGSGTSEGRTQNNDKTEEEQTDVNAGGSNVTDTGVNVENNATTDAGISTENGNVSGASGTESVTGMISNGTNIPSEPQMSITKSFPERVLEKALSIGTGVFNYAKGKLIGVYYNGYVTLYKPDRAKHILIFTFLSLFLYLAYRVFYFIKHYIFKRPVRSTNLFPEYLPIIFSTFLFMLLYAAPLIGLPELIAGSRLCTNAQMLMLMMIVIPVDMFFSLFTFDFREDTLERWSVLVSIGLIVMVCVSGSYHGYLYYELTRYNAPVDITNQIIDSLPENTYTIVSPTDEIYQVIQYGRHEELVTFLNKMEKQSYIIPTEYIFVYVEKKPLKYAHNHFFAGPDWLALEKYQELYTTNFSVCPEIFSSQISSADAEKDIMRFGSPSHAYSVLESRTIIESKAYAWCQRFGELYPNELKIYYEDENFVCYYFRQNTQSLYNLAIEY